MAKENNDDQEKSTLFLFEEYVKKNEVKYYETLKEELHKFRFVDKNFFSYLENMVNECLDEAKEREKKENEEKEKETNEKFTATL